MAVFYNDRQATEKLQGPVASTHGVMLHELKHHHGILYTAVQIKAFSDSK